MPVVIKAYTHCSEFTRYTRILSVVLIAKMRLPYLLFRPIFTSKKVPYLNFDRQIHKQN